ncbi:hypothetical protein [Kitasatospora indigofera]
MGRASRPPPPHALITDLGDDGLDFRPTLAQCTAKRGYPHYDPRSMLRLLIHGRTTGVRSSRAIERKPKNWRTLTKLRTDPAHATGLLRALSVLTNLEGTR